MARKSANVEGVRSVKAVFIKEERFIGAQRRFKYIRQPFNLVEYDWGNGEYKTYLELCLGNRFFNRDTATTSSEWEEYDDVLLFDSYAELRNWPVIYRDGSHAK